jgi:hypothetical protein
MYQLNTMFVRFVADPIPRLDERQRIDEAETSR